MKRLPYLLIFLLLLAQFDDTWAVASCGPSAPLTDDDDEYLAARQQPREPSTSLHLPVSHRLKPLSEEPATARRGVLAGRKRVETHVP